MKLTFSNIGRFHDKTEIEFNGITVIAGTNGTGKSTISKIMYCIFDSFYNIGEQIRNNKISTIERKLSLLIRRKSFIPSAYGYATDIIDNCDESSCKEDILKVLSDAGYSVDMLDDDDISDLVENVISVLNVPDDVVLENLVLNRFYAEFGDNIKHVNYEEDDANITLSIKGKNISILINSDELILKDEFELTKEIVYLDDLTSFYSRRHSLNTYSHISSIQRKILHTKESESAVIDGILAGSRYENIISKMNSLNIGNFINTNTGDMEYSSEELRKNIGIQNVSAGTRVLATIKKLIANGYIEERGLVIFDEPEVHMHPEWQYVLAEMIVIMQQELNMNVLINTHSADFIAFLNHFSEKYQIKEKCKYYQAKTNSDESTSYLKDVTDDIQTVFEELSNKFISVTEEIY